MTASGQAEGAPGTTPEASAEEQKKAAFLASLTPQRGEVDLKDGLAQLKLPPAYRYLTPADTDRVLQAWGNPPSPDTLGMIYPGDADLFGDDSWAVIVTYLDDGHVDDEDAKDIDYAELLSDMQEDSAADNELREKAGYASVRLVGWAEPPHYDASTKKLYWAKELAFGPHLPRVRLRRSSVESTVSSTCS